MMFVQTMHFVIAITRYFCHRQVNTLDKQNTLAHATKKGRPQASSICHKE